MNDAPKEPSDPELQSFFYALRRETDVALDEYPPAPDFDALCRRAEQLGMQFAPENVDAGPSPTLELAPTALESLDDHAIFPFARDLRTSIESEIAAQREPAPSDVPVVLPMPSTAAVQKPRRRRRYAVSTMLAAAATFALLQWPTHDGSEPSERMKDAQFGAASRQFDAGEPDWNTTALRTIRKHQKDGAQELANGDTPQLPSEPESPQPLLPSEQPEPLEAPEDEAADVAPATDYVALNRDAQRAWRNGDLKRASKLLRRIARGSSDDKLAESAFADLFSIGRQEGGAQALRQQWQRYLRRFPHGKFADDARAGLCNASKGDEATRCWGDYLKQHPQGTYRRQAEAAVSKR